MQGITTLTREASFCLMRVRGPDSSKNRNCDRTFRQIKEAFSVRTIQAHIIVSCPLQNVYAVHC